MSTPRALRPLPILTLALLAACVDPLGISTSTRILCDSDADCPPQWSCRELIEERRCLPPDLAVDEEPPVVESLTVPGVARADFVVDFVLSEPALSIDLTVGDAPQAVALEDGRTAYSTTVSIEDLPDGAYELVLSARDLAGNAMTEPARARVTVDQSAPALLPPDLFEGEVFTAGRVASIALVFNEPVGDAADIAAPPRVVGETPDGGRIDFLGVSVDALGSAYTYTRVFDEDTPQGVYAVRLEPFADLAGNRVDTQTPLGAIGVDTRPPSLTEVRPECSLDVFDAFRLNASAATFSFSFCLDEDIAAAGVTVLLDGNADADGTVFGSTELEAGVFLYSFTGPPPAATAGSFTVELIMADAAGNISTEVLGLIALDNQPPGVADLFFSPERGSPEIASVLVTVVATEKITNDATLVMDPAITVSVVSIANATAVYRVEKPVDGQIPNGLVVASISLTDDADNSATIINGAGFDSPVFEVDAVDPSITLEVRNGVDLDGVVGVGQATESLEIRVTSTDADLASVSVGLAGRNFDCVVTSAADQPPLIDCPDIPVDDSLPPGPTVLIVTALDAVGNLGVASQATVIDFEGPQLLTTPSGVIVLTPPAGALVETVSAVTFQTRVSVESALADEVLSPDDPPVLTLGNQSVPCALETEPAVSTRCPAIQVDSPSATTPVLTWSDRLGNERQVSLPDLVIDTTPPADPDVSRVFYERIPWGTASNPAPSFTVTVDEQGQVEPLRWVFFAKADATQRLGTIDADGVGLQPQLPLIADHATLFVVVVDSAGNRTPAVGAAPLSSVNWTATLNGKVPGSLLENPHTAHQLAFTDDNIEPSFFDHGAFEFDGGGATAAYRPRWKAVLNGLPNGRGGHAMAFDAARRRTVLFGGESDGTVLNDTWTWDGRSFRQVATAGPSARAGHTMTFDPTRGATILFGGSTGGPFGSLPDLWRFNGASWQEIVPTGQGPATGSGTDQQRIAYDASTNQLVVFTFSGGVAEVCPLDDRDAWNCQQPADGPAAIGPTRYIMGLRGAGVLAVVQNNVGNSTFRWESGAWISEGAGPALDLAFDGAIVDDVNGGVRIAERDGRVFLYNDPGWSLESSGNTTQPSGFAMSHDPRSPIVFGGGTSNALSRYEKTQLFEVSFARPPARTAAANSEGPVTGTWLLFGGRSGQAPLGDTWLMTPGGFVAQTLDPGGGFPSARHGAALGRIDPGSDPMVVLYGGSVAGSLDALDLPSDTWLFRPGQGWAERLAPDSGPGVRGTAMAAFGDGTQLVRFGGLLGDSTFDDSTFTFDGSNWSPATPALQIQARHQHAMTYDPVRQRAILYGGEVEGILSSDGEARTFADAANAWLSAGNGIARVRHRLVHDRVEVLAYGGDSAGVTRIRDDGTVVEQPTVNTPLPRDAPVFGVVGDDDVFIFGGEVGSAVTDELLFLEGMDGGAPAVQFRVNLAAAGLPDQRVTVDHIRARIGGQAGAASGAELQVWSPEVGAWFKVAQSSATDVDPVLATCDACGDFLAVDNALHIRAVPLNPGDRDDRPRVRAGALEVTVTFSEAP